MAEAAAASLRRDAGLVFQQANARPEAVRPPQQILTMRSADDSLAFITRPIGAGTGRVLTGFQISVSPASPRERTIS